MAYQNVGKCRFYIDTISYLKSLGQDYTISFDNDLCRFDPINQKEIEFDSSNPQTIVLNSNLLNYFDTDNFYLAFLNHNIEGKIITTTTNSESVLNCNIETTESEPPFDVISIENIGTTIFTGTADSDYSTIGLGIAANDDGSQVTQSYNLGSLIFGSYYDMPSADLELSMEIEFDGFDTLKTMGGSTLTNVRYAGSPYWINGESKAAPFSIGDTNEVAKRNGRRVWNLSFSYISDKDLFASNYMGNNYTETTTNYSDDDIDTDNNTNNAFYYNINNDKSFISQVLNKIGNGQRFLFQPDNTNNNPDQFAICVLDQDSLSISQVAFKTYNISLKIKEVW
tara:strand:- start:976 stop:1992 length:1017 start_codon:yes stop_codon:yes gene_type:complete